jgi:hypothetical protein
MTDDFNDSTDAKQLDELAELFQAYFDEVDQVVDAM